MREWTSFIFAAIFVVMVLVLMIGTIIFDIRIDDWEQGKSYILVNDEMAEFSFTMEGPDAKRNARKFSKYLEEYNWDKAETNSESVVKDYKSEFEVVDFMITSSNIKFQ